MHLGIPVHLPLGVHVLHMDLNVFQNTYVAEGTLLHCTVLLHLYIYIWINGPFTFNNHFQQSDSQ